MIPSADEVLGRLRERADPATLAGMPRYAIPTEGAMGVPMASMRALAKEIGHDHPLALELWRMPCYEARTVAALVDEPARVTTDQMDDWCAELDSWAICDNVCCLLFDRTPHAFGRIQPWSALQGEFQRRAAFALLAAIALHDRRAADEAFTPGLALIEEFAHDPRNFVKKGISWALVAVGSRNVTLHDTALGVATRLAESRAQPERWVGRDALRRLTSAATRARVLRGTPSPAPEPGIP